MVKVKSRIGVEMTFDDGSTMNINEGDLLRNLTYKSAKGETLTIDEGAVRVICATTKSQSVGPTECPPEPYLHKYITPTMFIMDCSDENRAIITRINTSDIVSIGDVMTQDEAAEEGVTVVGTGPEYKSLGHVVADAESGAIIKLQPGVYDSPVTIDKNINIIGTDGVILTGPITVAKAPSADGECNCGCCSTELSVLLNGVKLTGKATIQIGDGIETFVMTDCVFGGHDFGDDEKVMPISVTSEEPVLLVIDHNVFEDEGEASYNLIDVYGKLQEGSSISGNEFSAKCCTHNIISLYGLDDNAEINLNDNHAIYSGNMIRIGFKGTPKGTVYMERNSYDTTVDAPEYQGLFLVQPYGTKTDTFELLTIQVMDTVAPAGTQLGYIYAGANDTPWTETNKPNIYVNGEKVEIPGGNSTPPVPTTSVNDAASFKEALASTDGGKVKLTEAITLTEKITVTGNVTIELNDQGLTGSGSAGIIVASGENANLKIVGNGLIKNTDTYPLQVANGGTLTLEGAMTIESAGAAAAVVSGGTLVVDGAELRNTQKQGIQAQSGGKVVINSGAVDGKDYGIKALSGSQVVINGGEIKGATGAIYGSNYYSAGKTRVGDTVIKIVDGVVDGTAGFGVAMFDDVALIVNGGTVKGAAGATINGSAGNEKASITIKSGTTLEGTNCGVYLPNGTLNIEDGVKISGPIGIVVRGGKLNMTGGIVTGTGTGDVMTGDAGYTLPAAAIAVDKNAKYSGGLVGVDITGGTIDGAASGKAIVYTENGEVKDQETVEGITVSGANITGTVFGQTK